jgi:hypothetical protein
MTSSLQCTKLSSDSSLLSIIRKAIVSRHYSSIWAVYFHLCFCGFVHEFLNSSNYFLHELTRTCRRHFCMFGVSHLLQLELHGVRDTCFHSSDDVARILHNFSLRENIKTQHKFPVFKHPKSWADQSTQRNLWVPLVSFLFGDVHIRFCHQNAKWLRVEYYPVHNSKGMLRDAYYPVHSSKGTLPSTDVGTLRLVIIPQYYRLQPTGLSAIHWLEKYSERFPQLCYFLARLHLSFLEYMA